LPETLFHDLTSLTWLQIDGCPLTDEGFPSVLLNDSPSIRSIYITGSPSITTIRSTWFSQIVPHAMENINIAFNPNLDTIETGAFDNFSDVAWAVVLNGNALTDAGIPDDLFDRMADRTNSTIEVSLRTNPLTRLPIACERTEIHCSGDGFEDSYGSSQ